MSTVSKATVSHCTDQGNVSLALLMGSTLQTLNKSESGLSPAHQRSISGYSVEVCQVACPLDCKLSDWSAWSACSASCGSGLKIRSKWLREKAFNGGRPCPRLDLKNQVSRAAVLVYPQHRCKRGTSCGGNCNGETLTCIQTDTACLNAAQLLLWFA